MPPKRPTGHNLFIKKCMLKSPPKGEKPILPKDDRSVENCNKRYKGLSKKDKALFGEFSEYCIFLEDENKWDCPLTEK